MRARLTIESGEGAPPVCDLPADRPVTLGRNRKNTVVLHDRHSSRWHAEIVCAEGRWLLRDRDTLNGTRVNGRRICQPTPLANGDVIGIGETCLRVALDAAANGTAQDLPSLTSTDLPRLEAGGVDEPTPPLMPDELTALGDLLKKFVDGAPPRQLIEGTLRAVHAQVGATVTGFLSLDPDNPMPKIVLPELNAVDIHLSRQLTQQAQRTNATVWLAAGNGDDSWSDSVLFFRDALCVPLRAGKAALGALHVYRSGKSFGDRDVRFCELVADYLAKSLHLLRTRRNLEWENSRLRVHTPSTDEALIGDSPGMEQVRQHIARLAPGAGTVLVVGESGVGKELVALNLHRASPRGDGPLVTVNCAAIAPNLIEAELFGARRGAFTGADRDRPGLFQQADEGTLFLDEIGELSPECQAKLLRVIEHKPFRPVGGDRDVEVDVRIIAATHRDLQALVRQKAFRADLFFRLGVPIRVPPLREHPEDIPALVAHFLPRIWLEYRQQARLTEAALRRLQAYSWPGNVRQLRSVLENAVAMGDGDKIEVKDLWLPNDAGATACGLPTLNLNELEEVAIRQALKRTGGHIINAAEVLGIHRDTLGNKMKALKIKKGEW